MIERDFLKAHLQAPDAPPSLEEAITSRIERITIRRIWMEVGITTLSSIGLISYGAVSWSVLSQEIQESSFLQFGHLAVSDPDILLSNLQESLWSFIETIPMQSIVLGLGLILCTACLIGFLLRLREVRQQFSLHLT